MFQATITDTDIGDNSIQFSTKFTDAETELVYYGHRFYSPFQGRFINTDPIEEAGGLNLYGFCGNNGVNRWDMLGMSTGVTQVEVYDEHLGIYITYDHYSGGFDGEGIGDDFLTASGWGENSRPASDYSAENQSFIDEADARTVASLEAAGDYTLSRPDQGMTFGEIAANLGLTSDNMKGVVTLGPLEEVPMDKPTPVTPYQPTWDGTSGLSPFPSTAPSRNTSLDRYNAIMEDFSSTHGSALRSGETLGNFIGENSLMLMDPVAAFSPQNISRNLAARAGRAAMREALRQSGTPTSRPATWQTGSADRKQLVLEGSDGRPRVVTHHLEDSNHPEPHWHVAEPKVDPLTGDMRTNKYGEIKYTSGKSKGDKSN